MSWLFPTSRSTSPSMTLPLLVSYNKQQYKVPVDPRTTTLAELKSQLQSLLHLKDPQATTIVFAGAVMKDDKRRLSEYHVKSGDRLLVLPRSEELKPEVKVEKPKVKKDDERVLDYVMEGCQQAFSIWHRFQHTADHFMRLQSAPEEEGGRLKELQDPYNSLLSFINCSPNTTNTTANTIYDTDSVADSKQLVRMYRQLNETYMRVILQLDGLECAEDTARVLRKSAVKTIQRVLTALDQLVLELGLDLQFDKK